MFCWLVAYRPSNMPVYLRDGSAQTILRAAHTEIEAADQTFHLTQSQYTDTGPTGPSTVPISPFPWQGSHWSANFEVTGMTRSTPEKIPAQAGFEPGDLPLSRRTSLTTRPTRRCKKGKERKKEQKKKERETGGSTDRNMDRKMDR